MDRPVGRSLRKAEPALSVEFGPSYVLTRALGGEWQAVQVQRVLEKISRRSSHRLIIALA